MKKRGQIIRYYPLGFWEFRNIRVILFPPDDAVMELLELSPDTRTNTVIAAKGKLPTATQCHRCQTPAQCYMANKPLQ